MSEQFVRVVTLKEAAHQAASDCYSIAKTLLADGRRVKFTVGEDCEPMSIKQRKFFHGPVLGQISEQARVEGVRFLPRVWKEHLHNLFIPDDWVMERGFVKDKATGKLRLARRKTPHRVRRSTESLTVKQYSIFIDQSIAHAAVEWGVEFRFDLDEREAVRYQRPRAKQKEAETC